MNPLKISAIAAALMFGMTVAPALADAPKALNKCKSCHSFDEGGKHKVGPNLFGIYGSKAGATDFGKYKGLVDVDIVWDEENLDKWLADPKGFLGKRTSMTLKLKKEEDRKEIIEYLEELK
ncbi:MAG: c-type cytochrome [Rhodospirillaceae bacterium]|nr:c-type cytochrome [Rhodospirillaceae bacterium]